MSLQRRSLVDKPKIGKCLSFSVSNDKSLLDILDSVEEIKDDKTLIDNNRINNNKCKCCDKVIFNKTLLDEHQVKCFQNKILSMSIQMNLMRENIKHEIHIKGLEILIERNNKKWNSLME